jgi:hypothetical protein
MIGQSVPYESWDLKTLRDDIKSLFGDEQLTLAAKPITSFCLRQQYARYHYKEALHRFDAILETGVDETSLCMRVLTFDEEYLDSQFEAGAHAIACIQSIHTLGDILGNIIYYSLGMNREDRTRIKSNMYIHTVRDYLNKIPDASEITTLLDQLLDHPDYKYVAAVVNESKHCSVIAPHLRVDMTGDGNHSLVFIAFNRKDVQFPPRVVSDVLPNEFARQTALMLAVGNKLNEWVKARMTARMHGE